jgi:hypothetical protein
VPTGARLETRLVKVLKALATELDLSFGDLLEGIVLHAFEGKAPFSAGTLKEIKALKSVYGLDLAAPRPQNQAVPDRREPAGRFTFARRPGAGQVLAPS